MGLIDTQEADAKKAASKAAAKEAKAAAKEAAAKEQADTEMKDTEPETQVNGLAETGNTDEPTTEDAPVIEDPIAKATSAASDPNPIEHTSKDISQPENALIDGEKSTESGINGQSTAERITSVLSSAFLAN